MTPVMTPMARLLKILSTVTTMIMTLSNAGIYLNMISGNDLK